MAITGFRYPIGAKVEALYDDEWLAAEIHAAKNDKYDVVWESDGSVSEGLSSAEIRYPAS